jgi:uncharacterized protein
MDADELSTPLGLDRKRKPPFRISGYQALLAASAIFALAFLASAFVARHRSGEDPTNAPATAALAPPAVPSSKPEPSERAAAGSQGIEETRSSREPAVLPPVPPARTVTIIDGTSGKRQEVVIPAWGNSRDADPPTPEPQREPSTGKPPASPLPGRR